MPPSSVTQCLSVQGFTLQLPVREEALLPSLAHSLAAFSFLDFQRTCGLPHVRRHTWNSEAENGGGTANTIAFRKCVAYQDCVVREDSEIWYLCTFNTAPCLAVFCAVICKHHIQLDGRVMGQDRSHDILLIRSVSPPAPGEYMGSIQQMSIMCKA